MARECSTIRESYRTGQSNEARPGVTIMQPVRTLIALFIVRPGIAAIRSLRAPAVSGTGPMTVGQLQAQLGAGLALDGAGGSQLRQKLIEAASEDPTAAALVVKGWMDRKPAE